MKFVNKIFGKPSGAHSGSAALSTSDESQGDALAHVHQLDYGATLLECALSGGDMQKRARQRIADLFDADAVSIKTLQHDIEDELTLLGILSLRSDIAHLDNFLTEHHSEDEITEYCLLTNMAALRRHLLKHVHEESHLKRLEKHFKTRDKSCYRDIRNHFEAIKVRAAEEAALIEKLAKLKSEIEAHSARAFNADYRTKYNSLLRRQALLAEQADSAWRSTTTEALASCHAKIEAHAESLEKTDTLPEDQSELVGQLIEETCKCYTSIWKNISLDEAHVRANFDQLKTRWQALANASEAHTVESSRFFRIVEAGENLLTNIAAESQLKKALLAFEDDTTPIPELNAQNKLIQPHIKSLSRVFSADIPASITAILDTYSAREKRLSTAEEKRKTHFKQIGIDIGRAKAAVNNGQLRRAQGIHHSLEKRIDETDNVPQHIQRNFDELVTSIENLGDWQSYAIKPKLEKLISDMQTLADAPLSPELQATRIQAYQHEWKDVAGSGAAKFQDLWLAFKQASDSAYEVCKRHYEARDEQKKINADHCTQLISHLHEYNGNYDWENPDWSQVEKILRSAKTEWQNYSPLPKNVQKKLRNAFTDALKPIQQRIDDEQLHNKSEKERLIRSLAQIKDSDDLSHAMDVAKKFQKQWKNIGRCHHRDEDKLWNEFRSHCDAIFSQRDNLRAEKNAEIDQAVAAAESFIQTAISILEADEEAFHEQAQQLDALKTQFDAIDHLPKQRKQKLGQKLNAIQTKIEARSEQSRKRKHTHAWQQLFALNKEANHVLYNDGQNDEKAEIENSLKQLSHVPNQCIKALAGKLSLLVTDQKTRDENKLCLQKLCIRAEIISDQQTPESDKLLRMQYQVELLQQGLNAQHHHNNPNSLAADWLAVGPVVPEDYALYFDRFFTSWNQL